MMKVQVNYIEWRTLQNRGAVDQATDSKVDGTLLVGKEPVLDFEAHYSRYGNDYVKIYPAFHNGVRCFIRSEKWCPADEYSARGTQEYIIPFEEGVKLFLEHGVFSFDLPEVKVKK